MRVRWQITALLVLQHGARNLVAWLVASAARADPSWKLGLRTIEHGDVFNLLDLAFTISPLDRHSSAVAVSAAR